MDKNFIKLNVFVLNIKKKLFAIYFEPFFSFQMTSIDLQKYLGAGVLIVDTNTSSLLLVYDYTQNYNCCGGFIKYDCTDLQRIEKTAREELYEETRTLISCDIKHLAVCPFVDLDIHDDIFRCYILKISCDSDICEQFQNFNVDKLENADEDYYETTSMAFFPLKQFRKKKYMSEIEKTSMAKSIDKKEYSLNPRVLSVIKAAVQKKLL